ncbi:O-antigen ligase family protein [Mycolicibacterium elephantis]|uniref:O-antigen ligase family protein n=1 Tax=Mycolicibacterium elephantis TaxID=81858 RepID=UPI0009F1E55C|nr:O-antigen ligase family protein [Mycolicibacterium elephantis]
MPRQDLIGKSMLALAAIGICPLVAWVAFGHGTLVTYAVIGLLGLIIGVYIGLRHPLWLFWGTAAVIGGLPFGYFPGVHIPLYLLFAAGAVLAAIIHPSQRTRLSTLEIAILALLVASAISVVGTGVTVPAVLLYAKWGIATAFAIALLRLSRENVARFGRIFVYAASANAFVGILMATVDQQQRLLKPLQIFGYGVGAGLREQTALYVYSNEGGTIGRTLRLGGTWVLPNSAGLALATALIICLVLFTGWRRAVMSTVIVVALLLTLSRSMIFSVAVGVLLVLLFHSMRARDRQIAIGLIGVGAAAALLTPMIRDRILSTFADEDTGREARADSIADFPHRMSGHWLLGLGWDRPEFRSGQLAQSLNYVSNAPLLTVYRGGIISGLAFVAVLVIGCVVAYRALRSPSLPHAVYGGVFIGIAVVSANLQQSVVDMPQMTLTFSILLVFLVYVDQTRHGPRTGVATPHESAAPGGELTKLR